MEHTTVTIDMIREAAGRIGPHIIKTPLLREYALSESLGGEIYCKPEMLQRTGSFKIRGALNKILSLSPEEKSRGIICSSSGNHGKACAYIGREYGIKTVVVLPEDTPSEKVRDVRAFGGEVILGPRLYDDRWNMVREEQAKHDYTIVHAYEDYTVMAGQGTVGLEILEALPAIDTIVVPVGGGGLISGIATAVKTLSPDTKVIGVQTKASAGYAESFLAGHPVEVPCLPTLADGITCRRPGTNPFPIIMKYVDKFVTVGEEAIADAVRLTARNTKLIAEPTSCVGIAAVLEGQLKPEKSEKMCFVLTSGNWDIDVLGKIYNHESVDSFL